MKHFRVTKVAPGFRLVADESQVTQLPTGPVWIFESEAPENFPRTSVPVVPCSASFAIYLRLHERLWASLVASGGYYAPDHDQLDRDLEDIAEIIKVVHGPEYRLQQMAEIQGFTEEYESNPAVVPCCDVCHAKVGDTFGTYTVSSFYYLDVEPRTPEAPWRVARVCHRCCREIDPDHWINEAILMAVKCKTPFEKLPLLCI